MRARESIRRKETHGRVRGLRTDDAYDDGKRGVTYPDDVVIIRPKAGGAFVGVRAVEVRLQDGTRLVVIMFVGASAVLDAVFVVVRGVVIILHVLVFNSERRRPIVRGIVIYVFLVHWHAISDIGRGSVHLLRGCARAVKVGAVQARRRAHPMR